VLQIQVLGPVAARRDGAPLKVPGGRTEELLVRLAVDAGTFVGADRLIDELWADDAVATQRNTLQSKVARLRRALGSTDVIESGSDGYRLAVDRSHVDALAVLDDAEDAARRYDDGDVLGASEIAARAVAAFAGDPLPGAGDASWAVTHRVRLEEARAQLTELSLRCRMQLGDRVSVVGELNDALTASPYREPLWELLVLALYREGRQAEALDAYQRARRTLLDDLGLEPGQRLRDLEQQILVQDPALSGPADRPTAGARGNLPSLAPALVGRHGETEELADLLRSERLVELIGPGGVGKTALAIAVAQLLDGGDLAGGGAWLVRLEAASSGREVVDAAMAALGVSGGESALFERLKGDPKLVVLDNCEHVADAAADLAVRIVDAAPTTRVLCTSQVPLGVDGEVEYELSPLGPDDAVELFRQRAARQRRSSADAAPDVVRDLCRSLDGLPLAIELAAARTRTLSVGEIAKRIDDRFVVLSDPTSRRPERRRALRATIKWSYDLLFPDDQRGLWALGTFAGSAPLDAVEHVLEALELPADAALDVIGRLAARSLVVVETGVDGSTRYRLLDSIKAFAREACAEAGWERQGLAAHARWYADRAATSTAGVRSSAQADHLAFARVERPNIDAALTWACAHHPALALDIATGFGWAWVVLGDSRGAQRINDALAAAGPTAPVLQRADAMLLAGWIDASLGDLDTAEAVVGEAIGLAEAVGDAETVARGRYYLAYVVSHRGEWQRGIELTDAARATYDFLDRPWDQVANGLFAARAAISAADEERAEAARDHLARWLPLADDPWFEVRHEAMLGELARVQRRFDDAVAHIGRAVEVSGRLGFAQTEAYQTASLGRALWQAGEHDAAVVTLRRSIERAEATGDVRMAALARVHLGRVLRAVGATDEARSVLTSSVVPSARPSS